MKKSGKIWWYKKDSWFPQRNSENRGTSVILNEHFSLQKKESYENMSSELLNFFFCDCESIIWRLFVMTWKDAEIHDPF